MSVVTLLTFPSLLVQHPEPLSIPADQISSPHLFVSSFGHSVLKQIKYGFSPSLFFGIPYPVRQYTDPCFTLFFKSIPLLLVPP